MSVKQPQPASNPALDAEMQRKMDLLQKVRVLRDGLVYNRGAVTEGDPAKTYCWVNQHDLRQTEYQAMGWELVDSTTGPKVKTKWRRADGTHKRGDVILYQIDKEIHEAMCALNEIRGMENIEGYQDSFLSTLQGRGVPGYIPRTR